MKQKALITGCGGMLGVAAYDLISKVYETIATDIDCNEPFITYLDVRDVKQVAESVERIQPDIIFHLAALTDLEYCEKNPDNTWKTNALGTENVANICKLHDIPMVYICTAGIFDGKKDEYIDYDNPNPLNEYGASKYAGEVGISKLLSQYYVFRAGWMMGGGPKKDKKFVAKIMKQLKNGKKELNVVDDKLGTPTYTYDFIKNILHVVDKKMYGVYNLVCSGSCSRFDVAEEMVRYLKLKVKVNKVKSDFFKKEYFAHRPYSEKLIPFKLQSRGHYIMRDWKTCLHEYLDTDWDTYLGTR